MVELKEKNELIRLAALSSSFTREKDGQTLERVVLGKPEQKETVEKIMTYSPKGTNFNERYEDIRNFRTVKDVLSYINEQNWFNVL